MVYLPQSTEFLMASFRVYEAMVISRFIELSLMWYGGEKQLMNRLGDEATVRYNLPPLCCCLFCIRDKLITRKRIKIFRFLSAQMIHIQILMLFIQLVKTLMMCPSTCDCPCAGDGVLWCDRSPACTSQSSHSCQVLWQSQFSLRLLGALCLLQGQWHHWSCEF